MAKVRKGLEERENSGQKVSLPADSASGTMDSHMRGVKKEQDNKKMREAFGLGEDYAAGEAFDQEAQERKKEARKRYVEDNQFCYDYRHHFKCPGEGRKLGSCITIRKCYILLLFWEY